LQHLEEGTIGIKGFAKKAQASPNAEQRKQAEEQVRHSRGPDNTLHSKWVDAMKDCSEHKECTRFVGAVDLPENHA
jgi:hypothetical protein